MPLPEGRKPLTDADMISLLHSIAGMVQQRDQRMEQDLRETANRLSELVSKVNNNE